MREHIQHLEAIIQQLEAYERRVNVAEAIKKIDMLQEALKQFPLTEQMEATLQAFIIAARCKASRVRLLLAAYTPPTSRRAENLYKRNTLAHEVRVLKVMLDEIEKRSAETTRQRVQPGYLRVVRREEHDGTDNGTAQNFL
jgi:hypothetical protein